ncbi:hypothetical protein [Candidatus Moranella endobia]
MRVWWCIAHYYLDNPDFGCYYLINVNGKTGEVILVAVFGHHPTKVKAKN